MEFKKSQILLLIGLSFFLGMYIAFYLSFISSLFLKTVGVNFLPLSYIAAGLIGASVTKAFNQLETKKGFFFTSFLFLLVVLTSVFLLWFYFDLNKGNNAWIIFFAYSWFWVTGNFLLFVFWKLPPILFDLGQNQQYNALISAGEVISAVFCYGSIPVLLKLQIVKTPSFLMLLATIATFLFILVLKRLNRGYSNVFLKKQTNQNEENRFTDLLKDPFFKFVFLAIIASFIVRFLVDYLALLSSEQLFSNTADLAGFLAILFGSAKLLELFLKLFLVKRFLKVYGLQAGLLVLIFVLLLTTSSGLLLLLFGASSIGLIFALLNKLLERSLSSSIYSPSHNMLYQAFPPEKKASVQNYGDGFGKTYGQLVAGIVLLIITQIESADLEISFLFGFLSFALIGWWIISRKLIYHYRTNLSSRILKTTSSNSEETINHGKEVNSVERLYNSIKSYLQLLSAKEDLKHPDYHKVVSNLQKPIQEALALVFQDLNNIYPEYPIRSLESQYFSGENKDEVIVIEYFDLFLNPTEKSIFLPLLKEYNPQKLLRQFEGIFPIPILNPDLRLMNLVNNTHLDEEIRISSLQAFANKFGNKYQLLASTCFCPNPKISPIALSCLQEVDPVGFLSLKHRFNKYSPSI